MDSEGNGSMVFKLNQDRQFPFDYAVLVPTLSALWSRYCEENFPHPVCYSCVAAWLMSPLKSKNRGINKWMTISTNLSIGN